MINILKKTIILFGIFSFLAVPIFANILDEIDNLSPTEAVLLQEKLNKKTLEAIPVNTGGSAYFQFINPDQLNNTFSGSKGIRNLFGASYDFRVQQSEKVLIGGKFGAAGNFTNNMSDTNIYEDLGLYYGYGQLVIDYRLDQSKNFILNTSFGIGALIGGYNYGKTDENTKISYSTYRWGIGLLSTVAIDAAWIADNGWGGGLGIGYTLGKIANLRRTFENGDSSAPEIDISGWTVRFFGSKYF
jgi:hypothetical protein